jgi:hypothetical protein
MSEKRPNADLSPLCLLGLLLGSGTECYCESRMLVSISSFRGGIVHTTPTVHMVNAESG